MKKKILWSLILVFGFASQIWAEIGIIDMEKILTGYTKAQTFQTELDKKEKEFQDYYDKKASEVKKAKEDKKSEEKIKELIDKTETDLRGKQQELVKFDMENKRRILQEIQTVAQQVRSQYALDAILDKKAVLTGGLDVTEMVLDKLNK